MAGQGEQMNPKVSLKIYPRPDTFYRSKSSFNFDAMRSKIIFDRASRGTIYLWIANILCGILVAILSFVLMTSVNQLTNFRTNYV